METNNTTTTTTAAKQDIREIIVHVYRQAKAIGACEVFTGKEGTAEEIARLFTSPRGMEFCLKHRFPSLNTLRLFRPFGVERYGVYIDAGVITLKNPSKAVLIGRTQATIICDTLERHQVYVLQGASATVNAQGWSVVSVDALTGARVIKNVYDHAIIL